jgi:DNA-binding IclR family transcriptional regulator
LSQIEINNTCLLENELAILQALGRAKFRADSRWLAMTLNIPIDDVNVALQSLLRQRLLRMSSSNTWQSGEIDG